MSLLISIILSLIFAVLAILHFYWSLNGKWAFEITLPTNESGKKVLNPKNVHCAIIGFGLMTFTLFYLLEADLVGIKISNSLIQYGGWIIPIIFTLRSLGDFNYVGFFKKVKQTEFGKWDTKLFSPLSLTIGALGFILKTLS